MKQVTRKALSLLLSLAILFGMTQGVCAAPAFAAGAPTVGIGTTTLANGKYYTVKTGADPALVDAAGSKPADSTPYLYYSGGTLTVNRDVSLTNSGPNLLSVSGGTLAIAGDGSLTLSSSTTPAVQMSAGSDTLTLAGSVNFTAEQTGSAPAISGGSVQTADEYSGNVSISASGSNALNVSAVSLQTAGNLSISGGSVLVIASPKGAVTLKGGSVSLSSLIKGVLISAASASITATNSGLTLTGDTSSPLLIASQGITLSAGGAIDVENSAGIAMSGSLTVAQATNVAVTCSDSPAVTGSASITASGDVAISGAGDSPTVAGGLTVNGAKNVTVTADGSAPAVFGKVDVGVSGDVTFQNTGSNGAVSSDSPVSIRTSGGSIMVFGKGDASVIYAKGTSVTLKAAGNVLVQRTDDSESAAPVISAASQTLSSENSVGIVSGNTGTSIITRDGTFSAVYGGEAPDGLNLNSALTETTYYTVGDGYALFTPADGDTPAALILHDAAFDSPSGDSTISLPDAPVTLKLEGSSRIDTIDASDSIAVTGSGTLDVTKSISQSGGADAKLTVESGATLNADYQTDTADTIYGSYEAYQEIDVTSDSKLVLTPGAVLTLRDYAVILDSGTTLTDNMTFGAGAKIVNDFEIDLPAGTTADDIAKLPISGTMGVVLVFSDTGDLDQAYTNDGTALKTVADGGDLTLTTDTEVPASDEAGYTWIKSGDGESEAWTLTLDNVFIYGSLYLPAGVPVTILTNAQSIVYDTIAFSAGDINQLTFKGSAPLVTYDLQADGSSGNSITVDGAKLEVQNEIDIEGSDSGDNDVFHLTNGASVDVNGVDRVPGVFCSTVTIDGKSRLTADDNSCAVRAEAESGSGGSVTVTGGSTLTTGSHCEYGVYVTDGTLTVDGTSKLITNASAAPFCVVDTTNEKKKSDVLSLPGLPNGTEIASAAGDSSTYWSLVPTGGTLSVTDESADPVELDGTVTGTLTFAKSGSSNNNGSSGSVSPAESAPISASDPSTGASADLSGATMPSGVTGVSLAATPLTPAGLLASSGASGGFPDLLGAAAYRAAVSNTGLDIIGMPLPYNLKLLDQNGVPISFTGSVTVRIPLPAGLRGTPRVFRYEPDGTLTDMNAATQDGFLVFSTTHFSEYIVAGTGDSITLDTKNYTMPENGSYQIGVKLTGSKAASVKATSTDDKTATVTKLANDNYRVTGKNSGTVYIMFDVYDGKNSLLTHASVRVDVKAGVKPSGNSARQIGVF